MDPLPTFEGCDVLERVRSGPVADLYKAVQKPLGRTVTVKALGVSIVSASPFAAALEREARLLAQLGHPNVIGLYDFVQKDERMWLVLEHVNGSTLGELLAKTGPLPQAASVFVARGLSSALEHAHGRGVIHRDLRPQHVLVSRSGDVKLTDFAVAADERLPTAPEILSGATGPPSLAYASPEQILGEPPDPRSDLFSLGVVLYELIAGTPPFGGSDDRSATSRIRNDPPPPLGRFVKDLSPTLERIVLRCLQKLPSDRFQSAFELGEALALAERELGVPTPRAALVAAMHGAGLETSGFVPQKVERGPAARPGKSVGRATLVLLALSVVSVAGGAAIQFAARRGDSAAGDRDTRGRLELLPTNSGYLRVVAEPWAHVIVNGQKLETTPFARPIPLSPGTHYVRLEHPLAPTERRTLAVTGGETIVLDVVMHVRGPRADTVPFGSQKPRPPPRLWIHPPNQLPPTRTHPTANDCGGVSWHESAGSQSNEGHHVRSSREGSRARVRRLTSMSVELQSGSRLGHYELLVQLGRGGMATVWVGREASDVGDRLVAVKAMLPELAQRSEFRTMFLEEGQIVRAIEHPNVVRVHEVGEDRGILFMAMEWVQGDSLRAVHREARQRGPIPTELAVRIIADTAAGLHAAHELRGWDGELRNLVHCDVSPHNILVGTDGRARLVDFGVANGILHGDPEGNDKVKGKFGYMSPEQARGEPVDRRSDVFSLGIVLFELTTGERLFQGETPAHTLRMVSQGRVPNPARMFPGYPEGLATIVLTALERDVERRFQSAEDFQGALEQYLVDERMLVSHASVGQLVRRVLGGRLATQHDAIRAALVAADGVLRAGLVPESDPHTSRPIERLSEPPSQSSAGGGPFHQTVGSWPRPRRAPVGALAFGVLGVASAVAAIIWTNQTKPTALVTAPGSPEKPGALQTGERRHESSRPSERDRATSEGMNLETIPLAGTTEPRPPTPGHAAPAPRGAQPPPSESEPRTAAKTAEAAAPHQENVHLEETEAPAEEDVENPYKKLEGAKKEPPPPSERGAFSRGAATSALANAAKRAVACKSGDGPSGAGRATITFSPDGPASSVSVSPPFAGTGVGACVATAYRSAQVPAFTGSSVTVPHSFRIP